MFGAIAKILYGSDPAEFESFYTVDESVARLNAVRGSIRASLTKEVATGAVSKSRVVLRRVIPFVGNSFKPHFVGQFEERDGGVVLVGRFTMHWVVKAFMTLWLGGCVAWTLFALSATVQRPEAWFFPLFGVGMFSAGVGFVWLCRWFSRSDPVWLSNLVHQALSR